MPRALLARREVINLTQESVRRLHRFRRIVPGRTFSMASPRFHAMPFTYMSHPPSRYGTFPLYIRTVSRVRIQNLNAIFARTRGLPLYLNQ